MPAPYSQDLRERVIGFMALGGSARAAAVRFDVSASSASRWGRRWRAEGQARPRVMGGDRRSRLREHRARVLQLVAQKPDLTLEEIRRALAAACGVTVALSTVHRFLAAQKLTQKKTLHAAEQARPDVAQARRVFIRRQPALDPKHLIFIDETWAATNMTRRYGRCPRGLRLQASVPHGHWKLTTLVAGLRTSGISVPYVFDGAINGQRFRAYIEQMLAPTLAPGDIVLLDNLRSHKVAGVAEAIAAREAQLIYLPPYSPDLNPIEHAFAKYKTLLRKAAERTVESLWQTIGRIADLFSPAECRNFFNNAGYAT
ncbi:MAG TPA: IS630 family transposase [Allosphingosinicella sp.]